MHTHKSVPEHPPNLLSVSNTLRAALFQILVTTAGCNLQHPNQVIAPSFCAYRVPSWTGTPTQCAAVITNGTVIDGVCYQVDIHSNLCDANDRAVCANTNGRAVMRNPLANGYTWADSWCLGNAYFDQDAGNDTASDDVGQN